MSLIQKLKRKWFRKKIIKLKRNIAITQNGSHLTIKGAFAKEAYKAKELWFVSRSNEKKYKIGEITPSSQFEFNIHLTDNKSLFDNSEGDFYDIYLLISVPKEEIGEKRLASIEEKAEFVLRDDGGYDAEYPIRLGRFQNTHCEGLDYFEVDGQKCIFFITKKGNLAFAVNQELKPNIKATMKNIQIKGNRMKIDGKLYTKHSRIQALELSFLGRDTNSSIKVPVSIKKLNEEITGKYGLNRYEYKVDINLSTKTVSLTQDIYDAFLELDLHDQTEKTLVRLGNARFKARYFLKDGHVEEGGKIFAVTPYFTFKKFNLSLQIDEFERDAFLYMKKIMRWAWLLRPFYRSRNIWLVGERPYKAQDTGYHFFKYMREQYPDRNVYYVIERDSPELRNVEPLGNILFYKSKKHIWNTLMASKIIGSHHPDYLYPLRTKRFKNAVHATKVFLQHGVMGTKNMVANYGKHASSFDTDLFLVSSDFEKNMIVHDFGYNPNEVEITGLSRFDSLLKNDIDIKRQLLIIPTWRDWIVNDESFFESEYFERYRELIHHPILHQLAKQYHFDIIFCLHPNMQKFTPYFTDAPVRVISQGEVDVQRLLKESAMMITDYSSVGFDFSFLHKPILYYQFDRSRFIGKRPSHLDLENDLPGDIVYNIDEILSLVNEYAKSDFPMKEEYIKRAGKFLKYRDLHSSERIFQAISKFVPEKHWYHTIIEDELTMAVYRRFRKSRYYFPTMRLFYNIARRILPVDEKLIVFESGVGKQYADSPRMIYEEIVERGLDYKKVWFYNKKHKFHDPQTKRVARLSPKYYYYMAKAKYWVNNQNFPTYIKKRKATTYLQTWHGTPLKKMLFDIEEVQGRSDDYVDRVYRASQSWDYLISPSSYATKAFKSAFKYEGNILEVGYPRNDLFYKPEKNEVAAMVRNRLRLPENKKVILYAPTFRDNQKEKNKFVFDIPFDFEQLKEKLGEEYILLLRMHVVVSGKIHIPEEVRDFVYNVSKYPDIQELYLITDILMTDYSSVMFDFANLKRPMLFYTYDFELYRDQLRGFYMNFEEEAPGPFLRTTDDIIDAVRNIDQIQQRYGERYEAFYEKYCGLEDGKATERVVDRLFAK